MKILFVTSECAPFSKSGGLADVAFSLPPALKHKGNDVEIITPYYKCVRERFADEIRHVCELKIALGNQATDCDLLKGKLNGVPVWFIDNPALFDRERLYGYDDDKYRFAWFSKAVIDVLDRIGFVPDILHCNDWESALSVIYLKDDQARRATFRNVRTVFTIHNIAYQGQFGRNELTTTFALDPGWYDGGLGYIYEGREDVNLMKGAMLMADAVSTVSPTIRPGSRRISFSVQAMKPTYGPPKDSGREGDTRCLMFALERLHPDFKQTLTVSPPEPEQEMTDAELENRIEELIAERRRAREDAANDAPADGEADS